MKKLFMIFTAAALTVAVNTGCDIDAEISDRGNKMVIHDIVVNTDGWKIATVAGGGFDYFYADIELPELTGYIFNEGDYRTYWRYQEEREGQVVDVQEPLPAVINLDRFENDYWIPYTETISCSFDYNPHEDDNYGYMRIMISRSDFFNRPPDRPYLFRTVILW